MSALLEALLTLPYTAIRPAWINLRHYPFLNNKADYRRDEVLARHVMTPAAHLECLTDEGWTVSRIGAHPLLRLPSSSALTFSFLPALEGLLHQEEFSGFPIIRTRQDRVVLGYIGRQDLISALSALPYLHLCCRLDILILAVSRTRRARSSAARRESQYALLLFRADSTAKRQAVSVRRFVEIDNSARSANPFAARACSRRCDGCDGLGLGG